MKHVTDRYNMYYSYAPTKLNEQIHRAAIHQAMFAPLLGLFWMLFFSILRLGRYHACPPLLLCLFPTAPSPPQRHPLLEPKKPGRSKASPVRHGQVQCLLGCSR